METNTNQPATDAVTEGETPRTDAVVDKWAGDPSSMGFCNELESLACDLERELAEAKRERELFRLQLIERDETIRLQEEREKDLRAKNADTLAKLEEHWDDLVKARADLDSARTDGVPWELMRGTLKMERHRIPKSIHCESDLCGSERRLTLDGVCIRENGRTNVMAVIESALEHMNGREIRLVLFATPSSEQEPVRGGEG